MRIEPLQKELRVRTTVEMAFRRFTEEIARWWPRATHSVSTESCVDVVFEGAEGGRLLERAGDGTEHVWGTVLRWEPPHRVVFTWHPGRDSSSGQVVEVVFREAGVDTVVELVHSGWESLGEAGREMRAGYDSGWDSVLGLYRNTFID